MVDGLGRENKMLSHIIDHYLTIAVSVFSVLALLQIVKSATAKALNVPGAVWWFVAWGLGCAAALVAPQDCAAEGWRCWANAALINGGLAIVLYPMTKRIMAAIRAKVSPGLKT